MYSLPSTVRALWDVLNAEALPNALQSQSGNICHTLGAPHPCCPTAGYTQDNGLIQVPDSALPSERPRGSAGSSAACTAGQTKLPPSQWGTAAWRRPGGGEKKANEKAGWHCNQQEKGTAGNRGTGHLPWLVVSSHSMLDVEVSNSSPESSPVLSIGSGHP